MPGTRILVLRHGQSVWNAEGRWQGLADPPLSELGAKQAESAVPHLEKFGFVQVFSSDLIRASETASIISKALGLGEVQVDERLRERDAGEWTGLTNPEIEERWPEHAAKRKAGEYVTPVGAKTENFETAVREVVNELCVLEQGPILVVSHGGLIRTIERVVTGTSSERVPNLSGRWFEKVDDKVVADGKFDVEAMTETSADNVL